MLWCLFKIRLTLLESVISYAKMAFGVEMRETLVLKVCAVNEG